MRSSILASILALTSSVMPEGLKLALTDNPDLMYAYPVDTPAEAEAERVTSELTELDLDRLTKAEAKRVRKREKYHA